SIGSSFGNTGSLPDWSTLAGPAVEAPEAEAPPPEATAIATQDAFQVGSGEARYRAAVASPMDGVDLDHYKSPLEANAGDPPPEPTSSTPPIPPRPLSPAVPKDPAPDAPAWPDPQELVLEMPEGATNDQKAQFASAQRMLDAFFAEH